MKNLKKVLSVILTIITILSTSSVVMPVFAEGNIFATKNITNELNVQEEMNSKIVKEVMELREESAKHFVCEDGSYIVATYPEPVHYKENGEWKEINNTLRLTDNTKSNSGKAMYTPKSGIVNAKIPQSLSNGQKVSATNKGYTMRFGVNKKNVSSINKSAIVVDNVNTLTSNVQKNKANINQKVNAMPGKSVSSKNEIEEYNNNAITVKNKSGAVVYEDVFNNTDLEYIVTTNSIKENIVINERQNKYTYSFDVDFGELIPIIDKDNSIRAVNPEDIEETVFYIEAPYMYDFNETESTDVKMSLAQEGEGLYVLTIQASEEWINAPERAFPVIIDPTVYLSFDDVFVMDGIFNKNTTKINKELRVGRNLNNLTRTYIKPVVPTNIPAGSYISSAYLKLIKDDYFQALSGNDISVRAYDCYDVNLWTPTNITWENQPYNNSDNGYSSGHTYLSSVSANSSKTTYSFNITSAARRWLDGGINNGIMLASSNESTKTQIDFHSSRASDSSNHPSMYIMYTAPSLSISTWETDSQENEKSFRINTGNDWTAYTDVDWLSLDATSGTPSNGYSMNQIVAAPNTSVNDRTGTVTVKFGNTVIGTITVTQLGTMPNLLLEKNNIYTNCNGMNDCIEVISNVPWEPITESDWISLQKERVGNDIYRLNVRIEANDTSETRVGEIIIRSDSVESNVIRVTQLDQVSDYFYDIDSGNTSITMKASSEYNHPLATWSMYLSNAAYNPLPDDMFFNIPESFMTDFTEIEDILEINHFEEIEQYHYDASHINTAAHTIAHKRIADTDGSYKSLISVTVRGTTSAIEWVTDAESLFRDQRLGFLGATNEVLNNLSYYIQEHQESLEEEIIILVTGHSMGAAVANLVAASLNSAEQWGPSCVYAYTFATPNVGSNITTDYVNIFNILNRSDYITLVPRSLIPSAIAGNNLWGRHGKDISISMTSGNNIADNHKMDTYYNFMRSQEPDLDYFGIMDISASDVSMGILPKLLSFKCPVGVTVYDSDGATMAYESQQSTSDFSTQSFEPDPTFANSDVVSWISEEGEKVFFVPYGSEATTVSVEAYDYGTMTFSIAKLDALSVQPNEIKTFENVSLYPEKTFEVGLSNQTSIQDTRLFVTENGTIVEEITDLNPPLKSVTVDNNQLSYGTSVLVTIITDNTVSEIKIINETYETVSVYDPNSSPDVSVVENGNDLIWTIEVIPSIGNCIFDVGVKSGVNWHITRNAFTIFNS